MCTSYPISFQIIKTIFILQDFISLAILFDTNSVYQNLYYCKDIIKNKFLLIKKPCISLY